MAEKSTHYNLDILKGNDIYNPNTTFNNFEKIDTDMYNIDINTIHTATHTLSGTVNALTRTNTEFNIFKFVATAPYTANQTFIVDGTQVSAQTTNGQPLDTGCYVIGATVLCMLNGTILTLLVTPNKITTEIYHVSFNSGVDINITKNVRTDLRIDNFTSDFIEIQNGSIIIKKDCKINIKPQIYLYGEITPNSYYDMTIWYKPFNQNLKEFSSYSYTTNNIIYQTLTNDITLNVHTNDTIKITVNSDSNVLIKNYTTLTYVQIIVN